MKLEYTDGCICTSYDVNGKEFIDLSTTEQRDLAIKLIKRADSLSVFNRIYSYIIEDEDEDEYENENKYIDKMEDFCDKPVEIQKEICINKVTDYNIEDTNAISFYQYVFETILSYDGIYEDLGYCDCCGDHITRYTLEI